MLYFFSDIVNWSSVTELCTLSLSQPLSEVPEETGIPRGLSGVHTWSDTRGGGEWLPHPIAYPSARPHSPERHSNALTHPKVHHLPHPEVCHQTHTQIGDQTHTQERRGLYPRSERCGEGCEVGGRPKTAGAHGSSKESLCLPKHHDPETVNTPPPNASFVPVISHPQMPLLHLSLAIYSFSCLADVAQCRCYSYMLTQVKLLYGLYMLMHITSFAPVLCHYSKPLKMCPVSRSLTGIKWMPLVEEHYERRSGFEGVVFNEGRCLVELDLLEYTCGDHHE